MNNTFTDQEIENIMFANNRIQSIVSKTIFKEMQEIKQNGQFEKEVDFYKSSNNSEIILHLINILSKHLKNEISSKESKEKEGIYYKLDPKPLIFKLPDQNNFEWEKEKKELLRDIQSKYVSQKEFWEISGKMGLMKETIEKYKNNSQKKTNQIKNQIKNTYDNEISQDINIIKSCLYHLVLHTGLNVDNRGIWAWLNDF